MAKNELQAVLKDVERAGTHFQQKYWVSVDEVKTLVKKEGWFNAVKKMGGDATSAMVMLKQWTGWPSEPEAMRMQGACMAVMGGAIEDWPVGSQGKYKEGLSDGFKDEKRQKTVVAMQAVTRAGLENDGYQPRTMYRGMSGDIANKIVAAAKSQADKGIPYHEAAISLKLNALSSFSEKETLGESFGPVVVALHEVPAHAYVGHFRVQGKGTVGTSWEDEGVIAFSGSHAIGVQDLRGQHAKDIISYFKSKNLFDADKVSLDDIPPSNISNKRLEKALPKKMVDVHVAMIIKIPPGQTSETTAGHLAASGAGFVDESKSPTSGTVLAKIPSHQIADFVDKFSKTESFDAKIHKPAAMKQYLEGKAKGMVGENEEPSLGGVPASESPAVKAPSVPKPAKQYKGDLPTVSDLPDLPADVASIPVQQKKGKGAVPEWAGKKTWRDLWVKWAKQEAVAAGHSPTTAKAKAQDAVNKANVDLKKFVHHASPSKAQFKAFFAKVVSGHVKK